MAKRLKIPVLAMVALPLESDVADPGEFGECGDRGECGDCGGRIPSVGPSGVPVGLFRLEWLHNPLSPLTERDPRARGAKRDDVALVLHTSGTTNKPKIVPLTHGNIASGALMIRTTMQVGCWVPGWVSGWVGEWVNKCRKYY